MAPLLVALSTMATLAHDGLPGDADQGSIGGPSLAKRLPPMPTTSLPCSLADLLKGLRPCFTAPTFRTFQALVGGFLAQPGLRTVTGMLVGARLAGRWHHARAHRFFAAARWSADQLGLLVCDLIVGVLLRPDAPIVLVVDDSLFKRTGRKIHGAGWRYDATATGRTRTAWGNTWVVVGVLVALPMVAHRRVCLPVGARLWQPGGPSKLDLASVLVGLLAARYPDRQFHLTGDAAYAGKALRGLPQRVSVTTRLRSDAALYALPGPRRPGQRGRPRVKGDRLPELIVLAALVRVRWQQAVLRCYGTKHTKELASLVCLWPTVFGGQPVRVVLVRPIGSPDGYELALVSTDLGATPATIIERYADRWSEEVLFEEARQVAGVGQARNRVRKAVERTVPFGLACVSLVVVWYALHGQPALDVATRRALAPWYTAKHAPSFADMHAALRRVIIAAQYQPGRLVEPTPAEILQVQQAWAAAVA
jgi:DDE superfamily endonuclease